MRIVRWNMKEADAALQKNVMDKLQVMAEGVADRARSLCPVGKDIPKGKGKWSAREAGALRKTIRVVRLYGDPKMNVRVYAGNREVFYARFVEYGTRFMRKRPFLRPALDGAKRELL